jgi:uncharacterized protein YqhQ
MSESSDTEAAPVGLVGGNALPGGVMLRTSRRVGIAVRQESTGEVVTEGFDLRPPSGWWVRLPLARGIYAMRTALTTGKEAMLISDRLRWGAEEDREQELEESLGWWAKVLIVAGAAVGIVLEVLAFRVAPVVIAKQV